MVKISYRYLCSFLFLTFLFSAHFYAQEISVTTHVQDHSSQVIIEIMHHKGAVIDINSFKRDDEPIAVRLLQTSSLSDKDEISSYQYALPNQPSGLHLLPAISVMIDNKVYRSLPTTYTYSQKVALPPPILDANTVLKLEAEVSGPKPLFPGQRTVLIYRIYYRGEIHLTREILPLLDAKGFRKIGGLDIQDREGEGYAIQEIKQIIQAVEPGTYSFSASLVEGELTIPKDQTRAQSIRSKLDPMQIVVSPFPEKQKPASFNGAVGRFRISAKMLNPEKMRLGDLIVLEVSLTGGDHNLENVFLPALSCQPGFSGRFQMTDLPPVAKMDNGRKIFTVELRPLNAFITEIPEIEFSYFEPHRQIYGRAITEKIPIVVETEEQTLLEPAQKIDVVDLTSQLDLTQKEAPLPYYSVSTWFINLPEEILEKLNAAEKLYNSALESQDSEFRKRNLNKALQLLLSIERQMPEEEMQQAIYGDIANLYFLLQQYPFSILYLKRALLNGTQQQVMLQTLKEAEARLFLKTQKLNLWQRMLERLPTFSNFQWHVITYFLFFLFLTAWAYSFLKNKRLQLNIFTLALLLMAVCSWSYSFYRDHFEPVSAVMVDSAILIRGPGEEFNVVSDIPVPSGTTVRVINIDTNGEWLKIIVPEGHTGFVPYEKIRFI